MMGVVHDIKWPLPKSSLVLYTAYHFFVRDSSLLELLISHPRLHLQCVSSLSP